MKHEQYLSELEIVQNPALGAFAIWRFARSFQESGEPVPFLLAFVVLPLLFHRATVDLVQSTQRGSGLALFVAKLSKERENLVAVHERALALRSLTLQSVAVGIRANLFVINYEEATIKANDVDGNTRPDLQGRLRALPAAAEKLGFWLARGDLAQIATTLMVSF